MTIPTPEQVSKDHRGLEKDQEDSAEQQEMQEGIDSIDKIPVLRDR
jgi:hypothetical protein